MRPSVVRTCEQPVELRPSGPAEPDADHDGWSVVEVPFRDRYALVDDVLAYGADAVVLAPDEARDLVRARLRAVAELSEARR